MSRPQEPAGQNAGAEDRDCARLPRGRSDRWEFGLVLGTLGATLSALLIVVLFSNLPLNLDCALLIDCARKLLRGGIPYVDFVDTNPPMSIYAYVPPALVAGLFDLDYTIVFHIMVAVLIMYSAAMLIHLLLRLYPKASTPVLLVVASVWVFFSVYVVCFGWFGDKEHLFIVSYGPFLFCRLARYLDVRVEPISAAAIGAAAGPFMLLKPHFCMIVLAVDAWMLFRTRRFSSLVRPEVFLALMWGVAYALSFALGPAEMNEALWGRWLPFVARNYDVFDTPVRDFAFRGLPVLPHYVPVALVFLAVCLAISRKFSFGPRLQVEALAVGMLSAYGMFLIQRKGWPYHVYPMLGLSFLLAGSMAMAAIEPTSMIAKPPLKRSKVLRSALLLLICSVLVAGSCLVTAHRLLKRNIVRSETDPFVRLIEEYSSAHESLVWISPNLNPATQATIYTRRTAGTRFPVAWPIAMLYKNVRLANTGVFPYRIMQDAPEEERLFLTDLGTDIKRNRPRLVFIHAVNAPTTRPTGFIIEEYLQRNGWMTIFMTDYKLLTRLNGFSVYLRQD